MPFDPGCLFYCFVCPFQPGCLLALGAVGTLATSSSKCSSSGAAQPACSSSSSSSRSVSSQGWQLISSGQSVYCFQPGAPPGEYVDSALTVHVMEAPDKAPTPVAAALLEHSSSSADAHADIHRSCNKFTIDDVFFQVSRPTCSLAGTYWILLSSCQDACLLSRCVPQDLMRLQCVLMKSSRCCCHVCMHVCSPPAVTGA